MTGKLELKEKLDQLQEARSKIIQEQTDLQLEYISKFAIPSGTKVLVVNSQSCGIVNYAYFKNGVLMYKLWKIKADGTQSKHSLNYFGYSEDEIINF